MTGGRQPRKPLKETYAYRQYIKRSQSRGSNGLTCVRCGSMEIMVIDSRGTEKSTVIRRRRVCTECELRTTTYEIDQSVYEFVPSFAPLLRNLHKLTPKQRECLGLVLGAFIAANDSINVT